jgi:hypothetical protein
MSYLSETSLTSMKAAFPAALDPIQGIPKLASLIDLMLHMCRCLQTQKMPASNKMNVLFCAASPGLYSFFTMEAYPASFFPFPPEVDAVPNFSTCTSDNERETLKATNARDQKTQADIITMNAALSNVFLANLPKAICETYKPICMNQPNTVFLHMFDWFINKYGKMTTKDCKENQQKMAADWHPSNGFKPLMTRLFVGASYASVAPYPMNDCDVINIGLRVIKRCGMYSEEYINAIIEMIDSFKEYCSRVILLINQTSIPATQHGYGMAATDNNALLAPYSESLANFSAAYAATQETIKTQATSMATMQGQLTNIQQFCMAVGQQPPPTIYTPTQQQHMSNNRRGRRNGGGHDGGSGGGNGGGGFPQQPTWFGGNGAGAQQPPRPPTPYKRWENWNYCHTHGSDVDNAHTSATCGNRGPTYNPNASRANIMGGSIAGIHKAILPSARGRMPPPTRCLQQQQLPQQRPPDADYPTQGTNAPPAYFGAIQPAGGTYRQQMTMAMLVLQPSQTMMNFVGQQFPPSARATPMMQQPTQQAMPMMAPYYAPNQQTYSAPNQQHPGYF